MGQGVWGMVCPEASSTPNFEIMPGYTPSGIDALPDTMAVVLPRAKTPREQEPWHMLGGILGSIWS
jgi:hypothetical protein